LLSKPIRGKQNIPHFISLEQVTLNQITAAKVAESAIKEMQEA